MLSMWRRIARYGIMAAAVCLQAGVVEAQTRFSWPDSKFDIASYKHFESCEAVRKRVSDSVFARVRDYADTLHRTQFNLYSPLDPAIVRATNVCMTSFPVDRINPESNKLAQALYLIANQDDNAKAIVERSLDEVPEDSIRLVIAKYDTAMKTYLYAQPMRITAAIDLYKRFTNLESTIPMLSRVEFIMLLNAKSREAFDTANEKRTLGEMVELTRSMTTEEWTDTPGKWLSLGILISIRTVYASDFRDSLAISTQAFQKLEEKIFAKLVGREYVSADGYGDAFTKTAIANTPSARVSGDYWFPAEASKESYPRRGVVTLIMPVSGTSDIQDLKGASLVHRLKARWPELEIVMVTNTRGFFKTLEPPPPEIEAAYIDSLYRRFRDIPGVLAVSKTEYWRLPGYDRRRINESTANHNVGRGDGKGGNENVDLIDKEGKIVSNAAIWEEDWLEMLIEVLIKRSAVK